MSMDSMIERMTRWSQLHAEEAGLSWSTDGQRILAIAAEVEAVEKPVPLFDRDRMPKVHPLFLSVDEDELVGGYALPTDDGTGFACGVLDLIAVRIEEECPAWLSTPANWHTILQAFGGAVIAPCMAALRDALESIERRHVRLELVEWPRDADGDEMFGEGVASTTIAPIDTDDDRFSELGFARCAAGDDHATEIMSFDLDESLLESVFALVRARGEVAKRALRGLV